MSENATLSNHQERQQTKAQRKAANAAALKKAKMVKVRVLVAMAGKHPHNPGKEIEVPDFEADRLIEAGAVELVGKEG